MFDNLSDHLQKIYKQLKGRGKLKENDVDQALREIRIALIEADVSLPVIKDFLAEIRGKAIGVEVLKSLTPGHQMVKIVNDELKILLGKTTAKIQVASKLPTIVLMTGLQGSGKTTTAGKLARHFKQDGKKSLLVPADVYRPAAIEQLKVLGRSLEIDVYPSEEGQDPVAICLDAVEHAKKLFYHYVILDTAGRLQIDEPLMQELKRIKTAVQVHETIFVADAMMGQEAVNVTKSFHDLLEIDGIILTKMDGDTRGGAALAIKKVTGKPIKFIGLGETPDAFEPFHPERIVSKIIGMGDVLTFIDKAEQIFDKEQKETIEKKFRKNQLTLNDFKEQLKQIQKMGSLEQLLEMVPGAKKVKGLKVNEDMFSKIEAIIDSMTLKERERNNIINSSRKRRIAAGSGTTVNDVNKLLKQFLQMQKMMKKMNSSKFKGGFNLNNLIGGRSFSAF